MNEDRMIPKFNYYAQFQTCEMFAGPAGQKSGLSHSMKEREEKLCPIILSLKT